MQHTELYEFLLDTFAEMATLHAAAAAVAEQAWTMLANHDETDLKDISCCDFHPRCPPQGRLKVNPTTYTVEWHGQHCHLGPTILFKLIQRLARRPGRYFTYDILMEDVWQRRCSGATIRSAARRLRQAIRNAGMFELATAIKGRGECYGLFLDDN